MYLIPADSAISSKDVQTNQRVGCQTATFQVFISGILRDICDVTVHLGDDEPNKFGVPHLEYVKENLYIKLTLVHLKTKQK